MRVFISSFAALLTLFAFGPGTASTALEGDAGASARVGTTDVAEVPGLPPAPAPASAATLPPAPAPSPVETFAPESVPSRAMVEQVQDANAEIASCRSCDQWRYQWHNGVWWYWTSDNRWIYSNGSEWFNYEPAAAAVSDVYYSGRPAYRQYQAGFEGYYPGGPNRYPTGYGSYYGPGYRDGYYRPGGSYVRTDVETGLGYGRQLKVGY